MSVSEKTMVRSSGFILNTSSIQTNVCCDSERNTYTQSSRFPRQTLTLKATLQMDPEQRAEFSVVSRLLWTRSFKLFICSAHVIFQYFGVLRETSSYFCGNVDKRKIRSLTSPRPVNRTVQLLSVGLLLPTHTLCALFPPLPLNWLWFYFFVLHFFIFI